MTYREPAVVEVDGPAREAVRPFEGHSFHGPRWRCVACNDLSAYRRSGVCTGSGARVGPWLLRFLFGKRCYEQSAEHFHMRCSECGAEWVMRSLRAEIAMAERKQGGNDGDHEHGGEGEG